MLECIRVFSLPPQVEDGPKGPKRPKQENGSVNCDSCGSDSGENVEKATQKTEKVGDSGEDSEKVTQKTGELVQEPLSKPKKMEVVLALHMYVYRSSLGAHFL